MYHQKVFEQEWNTYIGNLLDYSEEIEGEIPLEKAIEYYKHYYDSLHELTELCLWEDFDTFTEEDDFLVDPWYPLITR